MLVLRVDDELELTGVVTEDAQELFEVIDANRAHLETWFPWVATTRTESIPTSSFATTLTGS